MRQTTIDSAEVAVARFLDARREAEEVCARACGDAYRARAEALTGARSKYNLEVADLFNGKVPYIYAKIGQS